ncbi:MAG TPA: DUF4124 domain-containing protein [Candidatus Binatia bacterium]|nr:DUF4124 domain-containing protein [Candidatus Binatia bacterium]
MKILAASLVLAALPWLVHAEEAYRWKDANGTLCYTNRADAAPPNAAPVTTRLVVEADRLPGAPEGELADDEGIVAAHARRGVPRLRARARRIYTEERLRFGCYASGVLYSGGWAHADDITVEGNCLPYLLGPEAWLNAARAELALRQHGIDWKQVARMYMAQRDADPAQRVTLVNDAD